jgi:hypothetical protein
MNRVAANRPNRSQGFRNIPDGSSGSTLRLSMTMNAAPDATPAKIRPTVQGESQPKFGASTRAATSSEIAAVTVTAPGRSNVRDRSIRPFLSMSHSAATSAAPASGTLTRKTARQPKKLVRAPPSSTPITKPAAPAPAHMPSARFRSAPSGNRTLMMASVLGNTKAPPSPCTARAISCCVGLLARPPAREAAK